VRCVAHSGSTPMATETIDLKAIKLLAARASDAEGMEWFSAVESINDLAPVPRPTGAFIVWASPLHVLVLLGMIEAARALLVDIDDLVDDQGLGSDWYRRREAFYTWTGWQIGGPPNGD